MASGNAGAGLRNYGALRLKLRGTTAKNQRCVGTAPNSVDTETLETISERKTAPGGGGIVHRA